jgi:hypothetical protein
MESVVSIGIAPELNNAINNIECKLSNVMVDNEGFVTAQITCKNGHKWKSQLNSKNISCDICNILDQYHANGHSIEYDEPNQLPNDKGLYNFRCSQMHKFIRNSDIDNKSAKEGCPCCKIQSIAIEKHKAGPTGIVLDINSVYVTEHTKLRWHCNKLRHNPKCMNIECKPFMVKNSHHQECVDFVPCNQDFYATAKMMKSVSIYYCNHDHKWVKNHQIIRSLRVFETYFDDRFDDCSVHLNVKFTGYNARLKIAFINTCEYITSNVDKATKICSQKDIKLIIIDGSLNTTSKISTCIFTQLGDLDLLKPKETVRLAILATNTKMNQMRKNNKLFVDRISH